MPLIIFSIASMILSFAFVGYRMWLDERREKRWFKIYDDLLNRKMAHDFYDYTNAKELIIDAKGRNRKDPRQLLLENIDNQIAEQAERVKNEGRVPSFINQTKPPNRLPETVGT